MYFCRFPYPCPLYRVRYKCVYEYCYFGICLHVFGVCLFVYGMVCNALSSFVGITDLALLAGGIEHQLPVHQAHLQSAHGAVPGNVGDGQGGGGADEAADLRGAVVVHAHDGAHNGHVVAEIVGEQGADGAINDAGGQNALLAGRAAPARRGG